MRKIILALALLLLASCQSAYLKNNYLQAHHTEIDYSLDDNRLVVNKVYCYTMQGSSMNPALFEGNINCFKEYKGEELKQGNIIHYISTAYDKEGVHRIIAMQPPDSVIVQGDNNMAQEEINASQVKGVLVATIYK